MLAIDQVLQKFSQLQVLVVGDVMIDRYLSGSSNRMSPEAPVPVVRQEQIDNRPGGAANVALNIQALGAKAFLCGVIGTDQTGNELEAILPRFHIDPQYLIRATNRITSLKTRILVADQQLLRVDHEQDTAIDTATENLLLDRIIRLLDTHTIHIIVLQDYNKGVLSYRLIQQLLLEARQRTIPVAVDPKLKHFFDYQRVALFKPNLREVSAALHQPIVAHPDELATAARKLRDQLAYHQCLITLGDKGIFIDDGGEYEWVTTQSRQVADVCGAGDTVISVASLGIAAQLDIRQIARLCNLAGGQVCERAGVVPVDAQQLAREWKALALQ